MASLSLCLPLEFSVQAASVGDWVEGCCGPEVEGWEWDNWGEIEQPIQRSGVTVG